MCKRNWLAEVFLHGLQCIEAAVCIGCADKSLGCIVTFLGRVNTQHAHGTECVKDVRVLSCQDIRSLKDNSCMIVTILT